MVEVMSFWPPVFSMFTTYFRANIRHILKQKNTKATTTTHKKGTLSQTRHLEEYVPEHQSPLCQIQIWCGKFVIFVYLRNHQDDGQLRGWKFHSTNRCGMCETTSNTETANKKTKQLTPLSGLPLCIFDHDLKDWQFALPFACDLSHVLWRVILAQWFMPDRFKCNW